MCILLHMGTFTGYPGQISSKQKLTNSEILVHTLQQETASNTNIDPCLRDV